MADQYELLIYDEILPDYFFGLTVQEMQARGFVTPKAIAAAIEDIPDGSDLLVRINSPGGSAFDGFAIHNILRTASQRMNVSTVVDGLAASAASIIAMAGESVEMHEAAMLMIHNASSYAFGNATALRREVRMLDKLDQTIAGTYAKKSGKPAEEFVLAMADETWYTAEEASLAGLIDRIVSRDEQAAVPMNTAGQYVHVDVPDRCKKIAAMA